MSLHTLLAILNTPMPTVQVLEAVEGLHRRSLIEQGHRAGSFTLQSVVLEYATARLIEEGSCEIEQGQLVRLLEHGLFRGLYPKEPFLPYHSLCALWA